MEEVFNKARTVFNLIIWLMTLVVIICIFAFSQKQSIKIIGAVTLVYYFISILCIIFLYGLSYTAIQQARKRAGAELYTEAINFVRVIVIWFLLTTIPLGVCGLVLVFLAHENTNQKLERYLFLASILICTLDAVVNPIVYLRKFKEFQESKAFKFADMVVQQDFVEGVKKIVTRYRKPSEINI